MWIKFFFPQKIYIGTQVTNRYVMFEVSINLKLINSKNNNNNNCE